MLRHVKPFLGAFGIAVGGIAACALVGCRGDDDVDPVDAAPAVADARSTWPDGTPHDPGEVWVLGWNIETFPKTAASLGRVADLLTQVNPDLVAVQEIRNVFDFVTLDE